MEMTYAYDGVIKVYNKCIDDALSKQKCCNMEEVLKTKNSGSDKDFYIVMDGSSCVDIANKKGKPECIACDQQAKCFGVCEEFTTVGSPECKSACSPAVEICEAEKKRASASPKAGAGNLASKGAAQKLQPPIETRPAVGTKARAESAQPCALVQYAPQGFMTYCPDPKRKFDRLNGVNEPCFMSNIRGFTGDTITYCTVNQFAVVLKGTPFKSDGYYKRTIKRGPFPASY